MEAYKSRKSEFVAVYGRRRVGKTFLVREAFGSQFTFQHTGVANVRTREQLAYFAESLRKAGMSECLHIKSWREAFELLANLLDNSTDTKKTVFIDELPWMDTPRSGFVPAFEHFWNAWASARKDILLIICGSATWWIINKVINSHGGLHNRVTCEIALEPFSLHECECLAKSNGIEMNRHQLLECYMVMGGVPFYWSLLSRGMSLAQNIDSLFFARKGHLRNEFRQLYASLFKQPENYVKVVTALGRKKMGLTRREIAEAAGIADGGTLTRILADLECCDFIRRYQSIGKKAKMALYQLIDNYTLFYFKFIDQNRSGDQHFWTSSIDSAMHRAWSGYAFERVCLAHVEQIKRKLGIEGVRSHEYSWRAEGENRNRGAQIDLLIDRNDQVVNLCEMKFNKAEFEIDKKYDEELRNKKSAFIAKTHTRKAVHITMVTTYGVVHNAYSDVIQSQVTTDDLF